MIALMLAAGLVLLFAGGEILVRGSSNLAFAARLSPLFVGLTIVAFGTSTPELVVSISSAIKGEASIALGNVIGSNIFNVLFILGLSAVVAPLTVKSQIIRYDIPLMITASLLCWLFCVDGTLSKLEAIVFLVSLVSYTWWSYILGKKETQSIDVQIEMPKLSGHKIVLELVLIVVGLGLLMIGCELFVSSAVQLATSWNVTPHVIGLTIVAAGTSLPELATSVIASMRGQREIAVGNVVGSNLFNILGVLGSASLCSSTPLSVSDSLLSLDLPVMTGVALICWPIFLTGMRVSRPEGAFMLIGYALYTAWLIMNLPEAV